MVLGEFVGRMNGAVTLFAQNRSILLTKHKSSSLLANITERKMLSRGVGEREALVFGGELVGVVDTVVAGVAEGGLISGAE